jgi:hypothetical protein
MPHPTKLSWTENDLKKLEALLDAGASARRAAAALNRSVATVQSQARKSGRLFSTMRETRKKVFGGCPKDGVRS